MDLSFRNSPPVKILSLMGSFNKTTAASARQWLDEATLDRPAFVVVDLAGVRFLDSTALSTLVHAMKRARGLGGDVRLASLQQPVRMIFEMTRLDRIFEMYGQVDEAVEAFLLGEGAAVPKATAAEPEGTAAEPKGENEHGG